MELTKKDDCGAEANWIKHTHALRTPFVPQIGDEVYYVPIAHQKYCEDFEIKTDYRLRINEKVPKDIKRNGQLYNSLILCNVKEVKGQIFYKCRAFFCKNIVAFQRS